MTADRLEQLISFHPFTRLNTLLEGVAPGGGNTPLLYHVGEPQFAPPAFVAEAIAEAAAGWSKYPPTAGTEAFRKAVKSWLDRRYRLPPAMLNADQEILPVSGTREALFQIALSAVAIGAPKSKTRVLMGNPFYHSYAGAAAVAGASPPSSPPIAPATSSRRSTGFHRRCWIRRRWSISARPPIRKAASPRSII